MQAMQPKPDAVKFAAPSATVLVAREQSGALEVLMLRRSESMRFIGGMWVFPGGRTDAADFQADAQRQIPAELRERWTRRFQTAEGAALGERDAVALHLAACRETFEEAGLQLAVEQLVYFGHWISPAVSSQRFDTRFFVTALPEGQSIALNEHESSEHAWVSPDDALRAGNVSEAMAPPTRVMLHDLAATYRRHGRLSALLRAEVEREVPPIMPAVQTTGSVWDILMPWDAQYASVAGTGATRSWPAHLVDLPSRMSIKSRRPQVAPAEPEGER